jgi:hypothetical protein
MLKVFLTATATGTIASAILISMKKGNRVSKANSLGFGDRYGGNIVGNIIPSITSVDLLKGGIIMGAGILIGGACPGTAFAQLGAGVSTAKYAITGGLAGALTFGYLHNYFTKVTKGQFLKREDSVLVDQWLGVPLWVAGGAFGAALIGAVAAFEKYFPSELEVSQIVGHAVSTGFK